MKPCEFPSTIGGGIELYGIDLGSFVQISVQIYGMSCIFFGCPLTSVSTTPSHVKMINKAGDGFKSLAPEDT